MTTERSLPRYLLLVALVLLLICGFTSPIAAADSSADSLCVEVTGGMGDFQKLSLFGVCITDCDGNQFSLNEINAFLHQFVAGRASTQIDLSGSGLNRDKPFKEVKLHLTLYRKWGFTTDTMRLDDFTLDVTDLITKKKGKPDTVLLKVYNSYKSGEADAVTIYDCNKSELKHFSSTHGDGHYGSFSSSMDWFYVELDDNIGFCQDLLLDGVCITDCDGNQFSLNKLNVVFREAGPLYSHINVKRIDLSGSGLNRDKPFKEVKLYLTLDREWGFCCCYQRLDDFALDVSNLVTKKEDEPYIVLLRAYNHYKIGKTDAVDICDCNGNMLIHFSPTHDDGHYGSWD